MILESVKYIRMEGYTKEWSIEGHDGNSIRFGNVNLIVGKNASGKSRTIAIIREVASLLSGVLPLKDVLYPNAKYNLTFREGTAKYEYALVFENRMVVDEILIIDGEKRVDRAANLLYSAISDQIESYNFDNKSPSTLISDLSPYPFLEKLWEWSRNLKHAAFTNQIEKNYLLDDLSRLENNKIHTDLKDSILLLRTFSRGKKMFGDRFVDNVKKHMHILQYPIQLIDILNPESVGYGICVKEEDLDDITDQREMSQGMYRALAFVIQLNFALLSKQSVCVLVDDLGEGLDFDRSRLLIDLLVKNVDHSNIQIFITTNDRYIMNKLPLKYWSVIKRYPHKTLFYNYYNSEQIFEDFKYTGLNNFDFLATDFYIKGFDG